MKRIFIALAASLLSIALCSACEEDNPGGGGKTDDDPKVEDDFPLYKRIRIFSCKEDGYEFFRIPVAIVAKNGDILCFAE